MRRLILLPCLIVAQVLFGATLLMGQQFRLGGAPGMRFNYPSPTSFSRFGYYPSYASSFFYPGYGLMAGYYSPIVNLPSLPPPYPYMPNHWWVSPYPLEDPRQEGYNPSSGYPAGTVTTLLLETTPAKARIVLDGVFVGRSDFLGPIQLPVGEHTLRVEAAGFEPSETVLKVEQPVLQQLEVRLTPARVGTKPGPRP